MQGALSLKTLANEVWHNKILRRKVLFTLGILFLFRMFAFVTVPGVDDQALKQLMSSNPFLVLLDMFSGGTLVNFSILAIGLNPYINASIAIQLMGLVYKPFEQLSKEGEYGKFKLNQYTRLLTLPLAFFQSIGMYYFLHGQNVLPTLNFFELLLFATALTAGTFILVWFGELISEYGVGNGISILILAGIVGRLPVLLFQGSVNITQQNVVIFILSLLFGLAVICGVVVLNEAQRRIPVYYAKRVRGGKLYGGQTTYLPIKLSQAGVIPIIFAVSFMLMPQLLGNFMSTSSRDVIASVGQFLSSFFSPQALFYNVFYFFLVVLFTFFYSALVFNPQKISDEIQKHGGFIPGIRPGSATVSYLQGTLYRITALGAVALGIIAILPNIMGKLTGVQTFFIGGTSVLILVSVILETYRTLQASVVTEQYEKLQRM